MKHLQKLLTAIVAFANKIIFTISAFHILYFFFLILFLALEVFIQRKKVYWPRVIAIMLTYKGLFKNTVYEMFLRIGLVKKVIQ